MTDTKEMRIQLIYSTVHARCGRRIARTHPRIFSRADLKALHADMAIKGRLQTIELYCHHCAETVKPTHIEITEDSKILLREIEIEKFVAARVAESQWSGSDQGIGGRGTMGEAKGK